MSENNLLLDTNILIYSIDENSRYFEPVRKLLTDLAYNFFTTNKNISEFLAVVTKGPSPSLSVESALQTVKDFTKIFSLLYPNHESFTIFQKMLGRYKPRGIKIHDFEIISIALAHDLRQVATIDYKDFSNIKEIELIKIV